MGYTCSLLTVSATLSTPVLSEAERIVQLEQQLHWAHLKITNQAKNPPRTVKDQSYMIRKVEHDRGAIGYVSMSSVMDNPNIKIVRTIE